MSRKSVSRTRSASSQLPPLRMSGITSGCSPIHSKAPFLETLAPKNDGLYQATPGQPDPSVRPTLDWIDFQRRSPALASGWKVRHLPQFLPRLGSKTSLLASEIERTPAGLLRLGQSSQLGFVSFCKAMRSFRRLVRQSPVGSRPSPQSPAPRYRPLLKTEGASSPCPLRPEFQSR